MDHVNTILRRMRMPKHVRSRVQEYYDYLWLVRAQLSNQEEDTFFQELSTTLRAEVILK